MKKLIICLLVVVMMVSACGQSATDSTDSPVEQKATGGNDGTETTQRVHLVAPQVGFNEDQKAVAIKTAEERGEELSASDNFYFEITDLIAEQYPNYDVDYVDWGWAETLDQKQRSAILSGEVPSIVAGETFMAAYAASGMLEPLPQDIVDKVNPSFLIKDKDGVPVSVAYKSSIFMLFYNKDLMRQAGLDPETPPKTWSEWKEMSDTITEKGNGAYYGGGIPSFPHAGGSLRATPFFRQMGVDFGGGTEVTLDDPKVRETLAFIREMDKNFPPGIGNNADEGPMWTEFQDNQTIAFAVNGSWQQAALETNGIDWGVTELPLPDEGGQPGNCMVGAVYVGVPKAADNKEDCFNLIRALLDEELQKYWLELTVPSPLNRYIESDELYKDNETLKVAAETLRNGTYKGLTAFDQNDGQIWEIINMKVLARTTITQDPIDVICDEAQQEIENLLQ